MFSKFKKFLKNTCGNVAVTFAVAAAPLVGAGGLAVDYAFMYDKKSRLQQAADSAALAAVRQLAIANTKATEIQGIATTYAHSNMAADAKDMSVAAAVEADGKTVAVKIALKWQPFFAHYFDKRVLPITTSARATIAGNSASICVLALDRSGAQAISMDKSATIDAQKCGIYSNSIAPSSISVSSSSLMKAKEIFSSGGYSGPLASFRPAPITDSPLMPDPLEGRVAPDTTGCDHTNLSFKNGIVDLKPGKYCGGITVTGKTTLRLAPGTYIIKGGLLDIKGNSTIVGSGVGFYLADAAAGFDFGASTQAILSAPSSGPLSGLLFFQGGNVDENSLYRIRSKDAEKFEGTVYIPGGTFEIDKASRVGQKSNWTAIIAHRILIGQGPNIVIKSFYNAAGAVPVPTAIVSGGKVRLLN